MRQSYKKWIVSIVVALFGLAACKNPTDSPSFPPPPPPPGAIICQGHIDGMGEAMGEFMTDFWYAYWIRHDSLATLITGYIKKEAADINNQFVADTTIDTMFLQYKNQSWKYAPNDKRAAYNDTTKDGGILVTETSDSLYLSFGWALGSYTDYYLKKLP